MELSNIIKSCMCFGLVKFEINGDIEYPKYIKKSEDGKNLIIEDEYQCELRDVKLVSIDIEKLREMNELFSSLLEFSDNEIDLSDLSKISSLLILKKLKEKNNDIERAEYLSECLENQETFLIRMLDIETDEEVANEIGVEIPMTHDEDDDVEVDDLGFDRLKDYSFDRKW